MSRALPRFVVAAPASGHGKTTVATGLMSALSARGLSVSGHKVGPDYIDPGYHAMATGRPGRNLDPFMVGQDRIVPLLNHGAAGADIAVIEGVMGLFDGRLGTKGESSTAHVAALTSTPVILVVDISSASRTHAAAVTGLSAFDPAVTIAGVILNKARSERHVTEVRDTLIDRGIRVLGALPWDAAVEMPSRHLGLVPAAERQESTATLRALREVIEDHIDLDAVIEIAATAPDLPAGSWDPTAEVTPGTGPRPVIAIAGGRAFTFRYPETEELLRAAGCDVVEFDPLTDEALPPHTAGVYLGGGFPEVHAGQLAGNAPMIAELRKAITAGVPTVAECAGLTYLCTTLEETPAVAAIDATAAMTPRLTLGYRTATALSDSLLTRVGDEVTGHEFHRTRVTPQAPTDDQRYCPAWALADGAEGFASPTMHASYLHIHWAGHPALAQRFADAAHAHHAAATASEPDLRHHGDAELVPDLADFAVNVYAGARPSWLDDALHRAVDACATYPNTRQAREMIAARHGRETAEVLPTAGAAEAFSLIAGLRRWHRPVVVHPQFTEPQVALEQAGHHVTTVLCSAADDFAIYPDDVPDDADLVMVGNPTNPTAVLHSADTLRRLLRPGRVVVVDEAFMDAVPHEPHTLTHDGTPGLLVIRSLTKHWSVAGIRAGYLLGDRDLIAEAERRQVPWSVSTPATAVMVACSNDCAEDEKLRRAEELQRWRTDLVDTLARRDVRVIPGAAPFVLAQLGPGSHRLLREAGIAVRRADTFPGLDDSWVRIAVRDHAATVPLAEAIYRMLDARCAQFAH